MTSYIEQRFDSHWTLPETPLNPLNAPLRHANPVLCHRAACDLTADDRLRRDTITQLMRSLESRFDEFEVAYAWSVH